MLCFDSIETVEATSKSIMKVDPIKVNLLTAKSFVLATNALKFIDGQLKTTTGGLPLSPSSLGKSSAVTPTVQTTSEKWVKHGDITLSRKDLQEILCGEELSDLHTCMNAFQNLLKMHFPHNCWTPKYSASDKSL